MFPNKLTANDKCPVQDCENLSSLIQMQFPLKRKTFSDFFVLFEESSPNFKHFEKEDYPPSYLISEITDCERLG